MAIFIALLILILGFIGVKYLSCDKIEGISDAPCNFALGHILQFRGNFCKTFLKWKQIGGPVFQLRFFKVRVVVFNDRESIAKICAIPEASGRTRVGIFKMFNEIVGEGVANAEGVVWAEKREFLIRSLKEFGVGRPATEESLKNELTSMLREWKKLNAKPFKLEECTTAFVANALWSVLASTQLEASVISELSHHWRTISQLDTVGHKVAAISPFIADKFSTIVQKKRQGLHAIAEVAIKFVEEHRKDWILNEPRDVIDQHLDKMHSTTSVDSVFHRKNLKNGFALGEIVVATMDATTRALEWFIFCLARNPDVASKLHDEIIRISGADTGSWTELSARDKMPYTQACVLESLRVGSVLPLGVPRRAIEDFEFNGAVIPKGTYLIMNQYGVNHDPQVWDNPEVFEPARFLTPEGGKIDMNVKNELLAFGIGRRKCLGYSIAMDSMFLFAANVCSSFKFEIEGDVDDCDGRFGIIRPPPKSIHLRAIVRA